jgi:hypothetical protein
MAIITDIGTADVIDRFAYGCPAIMTAPTYSFHSRVIEPDITPSAAGMAVIAQGRAAYVI